jgi:hypothetical protein
MPSGGEQIRVKVAPQRADDCTMAPGSVDFARQGHSLFLGGANWN